MLHKKTKSIVSKLQKRYGKVKCFLTHINAFELLCAVCLSAQCTDDRVNMVTPELFKKFPKPEKLAKAKQSEVEKIIKSCGFYKNKAKNLIAMAKDLVELHNSEVPNSMEDLVRLAGVGRKTANVVLGNWFKNSQGVVVDTHVKRIVNLLGLTSKQDPEKIEIELSDLVEKKHWDSFSLWLISLGREICIARRPQCQICFLHKDCDHYQKNQS